MMAISGILSRPIRLVLVTQPARVIHTWPDLFTHTSETRLISTRPAVMARPLPQSGLSIPAPLRRYPAMKWNDVQPRCWRCLEVIVHGADCCKTDRNALSQAVRTINYSAWLPMCARRPNAGYADSLESELGRVGRICDCPERIRKWYSTNPADDVC